MQSLFTDIRTKYNTLSPAQKHIADFVLNHFEQVILLSISDLAEQCGTSETTIVRFLRKLGLIRIRYSGSGWPRRFPNNRCKAFMKMLRRKTRWSR